MRRSQNNRSAFTLLELLAVLAIILILASLTAGSALRAYQHAKNMQTSFEAPGLIDLVQTRLKAFVDSAETYPALTPAQLQELGVFNSDIMRRIRSRELIYHPFTSSDPPAKVVAEVLMERRRRQNRYYAIVKKDLYREEQ